MSTDSANQQPLLFNSRIRQGKTVSGPDAWAIRCALDEVESIADHLKAVAILMSPDQARLQNDDRNTVAGLMQYLQDRQDEALQRVNAALRG